MEQSKLDKVIRDLEKITKSNNCPFVCFDAMELLKEYKNEKERNPVIVCPHCGKRVK